MENKALNCFCQFYQKFNCDSTQLLPDVYEDDVVFCDPAQQVNGLNELTAYFNDLVESVEHCSFQIEHCLDQPGEAYIHWNMTVRHARLNQGEPFVVPGVSYIKFKEKVYYHRDFFDLGALLYERLPVFGRIVRMFKKRLIS